MKSNVWIHLFEHISTSAVEWGLRDHSKPFHYEGFPFGKWRDIFIFNILSLSSWHAVWPGNSKVLNGVFIQPELPLLDPSAGLGIGSLWKPLHVIRTKWCKLFGVRRWELTGSLLVVIGCLFFPWAGEWVWIIIIKCSRVVSQSVVALLLLMKIHIIVVSMFLPLLSGVWECISSPTVFFSCIWFWDKRSLNPPCFFSPSMACVTIFCHLIQGM